MKTAEQLNNELARIYHEEGKEKADEFYRKEVVPFLLKEDKKMAKELRETLENF